MGILDFKRVPDKALPERLSEGELNATYVRKAKEVEIVATAADYSGLDRAAGSDSTAAFTAWASDIATAMAAGYGVRAILPSGSYKGAFNLNVPSSTRLRIDWEGELLQQSNSPAFRLSGGWGSTISVSAATTVQRLVNDVYRDQAQLTLATAPTWKPGDIIRVFSDDVIPEARPGTGGNESRKAEFGTVFEVSGTTVYLSGPLRDTYATNIRAAKPNTGRVEVNGLSLWTPDAQMGTWTSALVSIEDLINPIIRNVRIPQGAAVGISLRSVYRGVVQLPDLRYLNNNGAGGQYGYGILDGACQSLLVDGMFARNVRHAFTDDTPRIPAGDANPGNYGRSRDALVRGAVAEGTSGAAFDTHHAGERHRFENVKAINCEAAINFRGRFHTGSGSASIGSRIGYQAYEEAVGGQSYGHELINSTTDGAVFEAIAANAQNRRSDIMLKVIGGRHTAKGRAATVKNAKLELSGGAILSARAGTAVSNGELVSVTNGEIAFDKAKLDWSANTSGTGQTFVRLMDATSSASGRDLDVISGAAVARVVSVFDGDSANPTVKGSVALTDVRFDALPSAVFGQVTATSAITKASPITFAPAEISSLGGSPAGGTVGASGDNKFPVFLMDAAASEDIGVSFSVPTDWKLVSVSIVWANTASSAGDVKWTLNRTQAGPGDDATVKTAYSVVDSAPATAGPLKYTTIASNLAVDPTKMQVVRIRREGADAADTLANDAGVAQLVISRVA